MRARVLAVLAAIAMVGGALAVRSAMDGGGEGAGPGATTGVLVCAQELGDLCNQLDGDVEVEPANDTADRLIELGRDEDPGLDGWLVPGPWPQMVDQVREIQGKPRIFASRDVVGWAGLVVVVRDGTIDQECAAEWTCVVEEGNEVAAPATRDAVGVLTRAAPLSARIGTTDYGQAEIEEHGAWLSDLSQRLDRSQFGAGSLRRFLTTPGSAQVFITTDAAASSAGAANTQRPEPGVMVALSLGLREGASPPAGVDDLAAGAGWSSEEGQSGLPSPDVLYALRELLR